ncbi:MAG: PilW family protein [bacterium]
MNGKYIKNKIKKLEGEKGFTLVELLLVISIGGIIMIAATNLFASGINFFFDLDEKSEEQKNLRFLTNYITENVRYANSVELKNDFSTASSNLTTGETVIGLDNSSFKYKEFGSSERTIVDIPESTNIYFSKGGDTLTVTSLILHINGEEKKIILNNCENIIDNSTTSPSSIVFVNPEI